MDVVKVPRRFAGGEREELPGHAEADDHGAPVASRGSAECIRDDRQLLSLAPEFHDPGADEQVAGGGSAGDDVPSEELNPVDDASDDPIFKRAADGLDFRQFGHGSCGLPRRGSGWYGTRVDRSATTLA